MASETPNVTMVLIDNENSNTVLSGSEITDLINNNGGSRVTINAGDGDDRITNTGSYASINGEAGNDSITHTGYYSTITGGKGNDTINAGYNSVIRYANGDGNDLITNFTANDTLQIMSGTIGDHKYSGSDYIITVGSGAITLKGVGKSIPIQVLDKSGKLDAINYGISNSSSSVTVGGTDGADTIANTNGNYVTINADAGDDKIHNNYGNYVKINAGDGNDSIYSNYGNNMSVYGGAGNDTVYNYYGNNMTVDGGAGADRVTNYGSNSRIDMGDGNDSVYNYANYTTINGGAGNDSVYNYYGSYARINVGDGNDTVYNYYSSYSSLNAGAGNDSIYSYNSDRSTINAGDGNDTIYNYDLDGGTINGGAGNDYIYGSHWYVSADGGAGNDTITGSFYSNSTIAGGTGDDSIVAYGSYRLYRYANGDGNDTITNFNVDDTLQITSGSITSHGHSSGYYNVNVGNGSIKIQNSGITPLQVRDASGNIYAVNYSQSNYTTRKSMTGSSATDAIFNNRASYVTVNSAAGNDTIYNYYGNNSSLNAGAGNDYIYEMYGSYTTINAGAGNDTIQLSSKHNNVVQYAAGDGNDIIYGFDNTDTLQITKGSLTNCTYSGGSYGNYILTISDGSNSGKVTLSGIEAYRPIQVRDSDGTLHAINYGQSNYTATVVNGSSAADSISVNRSYNATINSGAGNDLVFNNYAYYASINAGDGADSVYNDYGYYSTVNAGAGNDSIYNYYGQYSFFNGDAGNDYVYNNGYRSTIDAGAGNDTIYNNNSYAAITGGADNDSIYAYAYYSSIDGGAGNDSLYVYSSYYATITGGDGNDSIYNSYGERTFIDAGAGNDTINNYGSSYNYNTVLGGAGRDSIYNSSHNARIDAGDDADTINNVGQYASVVGGAGNDTIYNTGYMSTIDGGAGNDTLRNSASYSSVLGGAGNDTIYNTGSYSKLRGGDGNDTIRNTASNSLIDGGDGDDSLISSVGATLKGHRGNDYITGSNQEDVYFFSRLDGHDTITNYQSDDIIYIAEASNYSMVPHGSNGENTLIYVYGSDSVDAGTILLLGVDMNVTNIKITEPYVDGPVYIVNHEDNSLVASDKYNDTIENTGNNVTIDGGEGDDLFLNTGNKVSIIGGEGNDKFSIGGSMVSVNGGVGTDSISNTGSDNTLIGGEGVDTITNTGERTIVDGGAGADRLTNSASSATVYGGADADTITNSGANAVIDGGAGADRLVNSGTSATIGGGAANDTIINSGSANVLNGEAGNDLISDSSMRNTITGGAGNDRISLVSGHGYDQINYASGDGNDTVYGFNNTDIIKVTGSKYNTLISGNDFVVSVGSGSMLLKNAASIAANVVANIDGVLDNPDKYIYNTNNNTLLATAEGKDTIYNSGDNVTITTGAGVDTIYSSGNNIKLDAGSGNDTVNLYSAWHSSINAGDGDDTINYEAVLSDTEGYVTVDAGAGNDSLRLFNAQRSNFDMGDGNDYIFVHSYVDDRFGNITIAGGKGNDTIENYDPYNSLSGGAGNDSIFVGWYGDSVTVNGGTGDDYINLDLTAEHNLIQYKNGDGKDTIYGFNSDDTLDITGVKTYSTVASGNDVIVNVGNGSILLKNVSGLKLDITPTVETAMNIINYDSDTLITSYSFADTIFNYGERVTVNSGAGDDTIHNYGNNSSVNSGAGNDYLHNRASYSTLLGGAGADTFYGSDSDTNVLFDGGADSDTFYIYSKNSTILGGDGDDYIENFGNGNYVDGGKGKDTVFGYGANSTLLGGEGIDVIDNRGAANSVDGGAGDDLISNVGDGSTVRGGAGDDFITNNSDLSVIDGGDGADSIFGFGAGSTLLGGAGNDSINSNGNSAYVDGGAGNDAIVNKGASSTVIGGDGADYIENTASLVAIDGGAGDDSIINSGENVTAYGGADDDYIVNTGASAFVDGGAGDDEIANTGGDNSTVFGGDGNDYIVNTSANASIDAGAGDDTIVNSGDLATGVTMRGGSGDDIILIDSTLQANVIEYAAGDGNDTIVGFSDSDTLLFASDVSITSQGKDGDDYVLNMSDDGRIVLQGLGKSYFTLVGGALTITTIQTPDVEAVERTITNSSKGGININPANIDPNYNDYVVNYYISNSEQDVTITSGMYNDTIEGSDEYGEVIVFDGLSGHDVFTNFDKQDTIAVDTRSSDILSSYAKGEDYIINVRNSEGIETASILLKGAAQYADLFVRSDGDDAGMKYLSVDSVETKTNRPDKIAVTGTYKRDHITNTGANVTINGRGGDDTIVGSSSGERIQFAADGGNDIVTNFGTNDTLQITSGSIKSTIQSGNDLIFNVASNLYSGSITLKNAAGYNFIQDGNVFTVDTTKSIVNRNDDVKVTGTSANEYIVNSGANVTVQAGGGNDTIEGSNFGEVFNFAYNHGKDIITNFGKNDTLNITSGTISGGKVSGDDYIVTVKSGSKSGVVTLQGAAAYSWIKSADNKQLMVDEINYVNNSDDKVKIGGTAGRDYIISTGENVTIAPGAGNDTIIGSDEFGEIYQFAYTDGKNLIANFGENDTLTATSGTITAVEVSDRDLIATIKGSSKSAVVTLGGAAEYSLIKSDSAISFDRINRIINSESDKQITGSSGRDSIINGGENVSIKSGKGNDTIEGSIFAETYLFAYNSGDNLITNFGEGDTLKATSGTISTVKSGDDVIVTITKSNAKSTVTLQGAADRTLVNSGKNVICAKGINYIDNDGNKKDVTGTAYADYITNTGANVTIKGSKGSDTITGSDEYGEVFAFAYTHGDNLITNFNTNDTIRSTSGKLSYEKSGDDVIVSITKSGTSSKITLQGAGAYTFKINGSVLTANNGPVTQINSDDDKRVTGTDDDEIIINTGERVTIQANGGDDTIEGSDEYGDVFVFNAVDGNDVITNFGAGDVVSIGSGTVQSAMASGKNFIITVKQGSEVGTLTLKDMKSKIKVKDDAFIYDGVNQIINRADGRKVVGSEIGDSITNTGANVTINGLGGNDTLTGSAYGELFQFASDGGNDLITNFGVEDTLQITGGSIASTLASGSDVIVNVKSGVYSGTITLGGAAGYVFNEVVTEETRYLTVERVNYVINRDDDVKVTGTAGADYITNSGVNVTIQAGAGNDTIDGSEFGEVFAFAQTDGDNLITNFGANDSLAVTSGMIKSVAVEGDDVVVTINNAKKTATVTLEGAAAYSFSQDGNVLSVNNVNFIDNTGDKKKITGSGKADYITNTGNNVTIQPGKGNDTIVGSDEFGELYLFAYTYGNNVITNFGKNDTLKSTSGTLTYEAVGNDVVVSITKSKTTSTITLEGAAALTNAGCTFVQSGNALTLTDVNEIVNAYDNVKVSGKSGRDYIINSGQNVSIASGKGNDTIEGSSFAETFMFAQTYGNNVITNFGLNDTLVATSGTISTKKSGDDMIVSIAKSGKTATVTLEGAGSYKFTQDNNALYVDGVNELTNTKDNKKITGTSGKDYIVNTGENVTITCSKGNDTITGSDTYGELFTFAYNYGKNVITNFGTGDTLKSTSGTLSYETSGDDYIVSITKSGKSATITLEGAAASGVLQKNRSGDAVILRNVVMIEVGSGGSVGYTREQLEAGAQLPASSDDYWFMDDEATSADVNEVDALLSEADADTSLGKLTLENDAEKLLTNVETDFDQTLATSQFDRKKQQK